MLNQQNEPRIKRREIEIEDRDSFSYDGFQVVRGEFFAHIYEPVITFSRYKVNVNTACIRKLPDIDYVQILVNPTEKKLVVRPCSEDEKDSVRWCSATAKRSPKQITCRVFYGKVMSLMDWNPDHRYKLLGKLIKTPKGLLFVFDLSTPETFMRTSKTGEPFKTSRTPVYPVEWQNQFGVPVEEHQKSLQINFFDELTVFGFGKNKSESEDKGNE